MKFTARELWMNTPHRTLQALTGTTLLALALLLTAGCGTKEELHIQTDPSDLTVMGRLKGRTPGYALLASESGLLTCLPHAVEGEKPPALPVRGVFWREWRLMDGWRWEFDGRTTPEPGKPADVRPDYIRRPLQSGIGEQVSLDPVNAAGVIRLDGNGRGGVTFEPHFDVHLIDGVNADARCTWDDSRKVLLLETREGVVLALASNGTWVDGIRTERMDYVTDWPPLDAAATLYEPGVFSFSKTDGATIGFAVAEGREKATELALDAAGHADGLVKRATQRTLELLDHAPLVSEDSLLAAAAAWDRWVVQSHRFVAEDGAVRLLSRPPLPYAGDPATEGGTLPAWFWVADGDSSVPAGLLPELDPTMALHDPEGFLEGWNGALTWEEMTADTNFFFDTAANLFDGMRELASVAEQNHSLDSLKPLTRWSLDVQDAHLPVLPGMARSGLTRLLHDTDQRIRRLPFSSREKWRKAAVAYKKQVSATALPTEQPVRPGSILAPRLAAADQVRQVIELQETPGLNLAFFDRLLRSHPFRTKGEIAQWVELAFLLWQHPDGLRFHVGDLYAQTGFAAPRWRAWLANVRDTRQVSSAMIDAFLTPEYASWLTLNEDHRPSLPGGGVEDLEVAGERVRFLYEGIFGLWMTPSINRITVAPCGPADFWAGRRTTLTVPFQGQRVTMTLDPDKGMYVFSLPGDGKETTIDLMDVPVDGYRLGAILQLAPGTIAHVQRKATRDGRNILTLNGVELSNVTRTPA